MSADPNPTHAMLHLLGGTYEVPILRLLAARPHRREEIISELGMIARTATTTLNRLERFGWVKATKTRPRQPPARSDYELVDDVRELLPLLSALDDWYNAHPSMQPSVPKPPYSQQSGADGRRGRTP